MTRQSLVRDLQESRNDWWVTDPLVTGTRLAMVTDPLVTGPRLAMVTESEEEEEHCQVQGALPHWVIARGARE